MSVSIRQHGESEPAPSRTLRNLTALEQAPALFALEDHVLRRLARRMRPVHLPARAAVLAEGDTGDSLYLIENGTCLVAAGTEPGRCVSLARLSAGDLCGEHVLLGQPSPVTVTTLTDCDLLGLDRTGLRSVLPAGGEADLELRAQFDKRLAAYRELAQHGRGDVAGDEADVIAVYAPKGGSGSTTIALNLAAQLVGDKPGSVLVMDLSFPHNQAALIAGLVPTGSLTRASWTAALGSQGDLEEALVGAAQLHASGFLVLPGILQLLEAELVTAEQATGALRALRGSFRHIVVDLGVALTDTALSVLDQAQRVVLVVTPELASLKGGRDVLEVFRDNLHLPEERVLLVFNQRQPAASVPAQAVERTLGRPPSIEIGHDASKPERAVMQGAVLATSDPRSELARGTRRLAELITGQGRRGGRGR